MAIYSDSYSGSKVSYAGCVIDMFEHNGYNDSDFYAECWDEEQGKVVVIEYDTTRWGGGGTATIDATEDVLRKVYRYYFNKSREDFDSWGNSQYAKSFSKGDEVVVVKGRKIAKGTAGKVFWVGKTYNRYSYRYEDRVGIKVGEESVFLPIEYVEKKNWENFLLTGKERKEAIRRDALKSIPYQYRKLFH